MDNFYGDNIRWFMGIVKDLKDPIKMGRVRVRIFGVHSEDQQEIPDDKLPVPAPISKTILLFIFVKFDILFIIF